MEMTKDKLINTFIEYAKMYPHDHPEKIAKDFFNAESVVEDETYTIQEYEHAAYTAKSNLITGSNVFVEFNDRFYGFRRVTESMQFREIFNLTDCNIKAFDGSKVFKYEYKDGKLIK
jgi:hypothetical protein